MKHVEREFVPRSYGSSEYPVEESGTICSDCGWLLDGPYAHPDAEAQHAEHVRHREGKSE